MGWHGRKGGIALKGRHGRKGKFDHKGGNSRKGKVDHKGRNGQATKKAAPERFVSRSGAASVRSVMRSIMQ